MTHVIRSRTLKMTLDERGRIVSLRHLAHDVDLLAAGAGHRTGMWELALIRPVAYHDPLPPIDEPAVEYEGHEWWANRHEYRGDVVLDADDFARVSIEPEGDGLTLSWSLPMREGDSVSLAITITGGADADDITFRASVQLPDAWAIKRISYPRVRGLGSSVARDSDTLLYPHNWGVLRHNPIDRRSHFVGQYPSGSNWCQMTAFMRGGAGVYAAIRDGDTHHTGIDMQYVEGDTPAPHEIDRWHVPDEHNHADRTAPGMVVSEGDDDPAPDTASVQLRMHHWPTMTSEWQSPYPVVLRGYTGGWFEAAAIHRDWATQQRWCRRGPIAKRDNPPAAASLDLWFSRYGFHPGSKEPTPAYDFQRAMHKLCEYFDMPFGVHWYHWHAFNWHTQFPTHEPVVEGFDEVVADLQQRGVVIMPYCQGRLLYRDRDNIDTERAHASVEANGQPYLEQYTSADDWPLALCPCDRWAQQQWLDTARKLWEQHGVEGVYFDQITAMIPSLCYHEGHGHALGGGTQYWAGYDQALDAMQPLIDAKPGRFLSSECLADALMDRIDLYLSFVPPIEDYVPLFTAVYGEYTTVMGRATPDVVMEDPQLFAICQGEQFLFGGQPGWMDERVLKYDHAAAYLRGLAKLRATVHNALHGACMLPPLPGVRSDQRIERDLPAAACAGKRDVPIARDAVRHTVWRSPDGGILLLLVSEAPGEAVVTFDDIAGLPEDGTWQVTRLGGAVEGDIRITPGATLALKPFDAVALREVRTS